MAVINKPSQQLVPAEIDPAVLDGKADLVNGEVPSEQLPSYVDDVLEFADADSFPKKGATGKIYVALDTNSTYRWGGRAYIQIGGDSDSTPPTIVVSFSDEQLPSSALDPRILALTPQDNPIVCLINVDELVEIGTIEADEWQNQFLYRFRCANGIIIFASDATDPDTEEPAFSIHFEHYRTEDAPFDPNTLPILAFRNSRHSWSKQEDVEWPSALPEGPLTPNIILALYLTDTPELQYGYATIADGIFTIYPLDDQFQLIPGVVIEAIASTSEFKIYTSHMMLSYDRIELKSPLIEFEEDPACSSGMLVYSAWGL